MIQYKRGGIHFLLGIFQTQGTVFPFAAAIATPCAMLTLTIKLLAEFDVAPSLDEPRSVLVDSSAWSGFSVLVGFLIIFRTSQAYSRFWDGCTATHNMRAEWFDACSSIVAFCKHSKAPEGRVLGFKHILIRLFSMLHALALAEIEDSNSDDLSSVHAFSYELIDVEGIDASSLQAIKSSDSKVELVFQWIQQLLVQNIETGVLSIPPPILSRSFQELATGMVKFHEALKISTIPFPFPYAQTCDCLLVLHWLGTPFVICQWVEKPWWAFLLSFVQVFILWCLNCIAVEIENPFGDDDNDIDAAGMQRELNRHLMLLIQSESAIVPTLTFDTDPDCCEQVECQTSVSRKSFAMVWEEFDGALARTCRNSTRIQGSTRSMTGGASGARLEPRLAHSGSRLSVWGRGSGGEPKLEAARGSNGSGQPHSPQPSAEEELQLHHEACESGRGKEVQDSVDTGQQDVFSAASPAGVSSLGSADGDESQSLHLQSIRPGSRATCGDGVSSVTFSMEPPVSIEMPADDLHSDDSALDGGRQARHRSSEACLIHGI